MDSIDLGRMQCMRFLLKATQEMFENLTLCNMFDHDTEKHLRINLSMAQGNVATALNALEEAIKNADKQGAN